MKEIIPTHPVNIPSRRKQGYLDKTYDFEWALTLFACQCKTRDKSDEFIVRMEPTILEMKELLALLWLYPV